MQSTKLVQTMREKLEATSLPHIHLSVTRVSLVVATDTCKQAEAWRDLFRSMNIRFGTITQGWVLVDKNEERVAYKVYAWF